MSVRYVFPNDQLGSPDILILPGSKNTLEDCLYLQQSGLAKEIERIRAEGKIDFWNLWWLSITWKKTCMILIT